MNDQTQTASTRPTGAASRAEGANLTDGLEVTAVMMTNDELAAAISYAFDRCDQRYVGGYTTNNTEPGKVMLGHLKELLAVQRARAEMVTTSNAKVSGAGTASAGLPGWQANGETE